MLILIILMGFKMKKITLFTFCLLSLLCLNASASIVYDNGGPDSVSGNETTEWLQTEDFMLAGGAVIASAGVYIGGFSGDNSEWDGSFQYNIFSDAGGNPGASLASGSVTATVSDSGSTWCCGGNAFLYEFNLNSLFVASAGVNYWFGIHASVDFDRDELYWVSTASNSTASGHESNGGTFDNWNNNGVEHAFYLSDTTIDVDVPAPAAWTLLILGMGALVMKRQRKA